MHEHAILSRVMVYRRGDPATPQQPGKQQAMYIRDKLQSMC